MTHLTTFRTKQIIIIIFVVIVGWGCAYQPGHLDRPEQGFNLISQGMEIQMGMDAAREIESEVKVMTDPYVQNYIHNLGQKMVKYSRRPDIAYHFKVIDENEVNAFALPGGFIYVNRGLIEAAANEAELAGVIGHEIGHVAARHGAKRMTQYILLQLGFATFLALSDNDRETQLKLLLADAVATGFLLKNSRDAERQADDLGTENLYRAGYEPVAMARFFDKLGDGHSPSALETFLSTHPSPGERVRNVESLIATFPQMSYTTDTPEFQQIKQRLSGKSESVSQPQLQNQGLQRSKLRRRTVGPSGVRRRR